MGTDTFSLRSCSRPTECCAHLRPKTLNVLQIYTLKSYRYPAGQQCVLGLATGSSPIQVYRELVALHQQGQLSFQNVITFNLVRKSAMHISVALPHLACWSLTWASLSCDALLAGDAVRKKSMEGRGGVGAMQDEYCSLQPSDLQSYHNFMRVHLFDNLVDMIPANIHIPDGRHTSAEDIRR